MKQILVLAWIVVLLLSGCASPVAEGIEVRDAWTRPAMQGGNGALYFAIRSSATDEIVSITTDAAEAVEMHESMMNGDVMEMHPLDTVSLQAGEEVTFTPGGLHVMLVGLKQDLKTGDELEITLHFKNYQDLPVRVPVQDTPASGHDH